MPEEGRGLSSRQTQQAVRDREIGQPNNSETCSETAGGVTRESEGGYRFYALYDKISRADILAHAYAQCRSNKSLPLRRQGAHRAWMARTLRPSRRMGLKGGWPNWRLRRQETYRPEPIRRVFIPKANGKLRPLGISSVRDRVCMTAAM